MTDTINEDDAATWTPPSAYTPEEWRLIVDALVTKVQARRMGAENDARNAQLNATAARLFREANPGSDEEYDETKHGHLVFKGLARLEVRWEEPDIEDDDVTMQFRRLATKVSRNEDVAPFPQKSATTEESP